MNQPIHPMVERMAKAMYDWRFPRLSAWEGELDAVKDIYRADARAAVQALMEPDEGMVEAGEEATLLRGNELHIATAPRVYRAMLRPLIGEGE